MAVHFYFFASAIFVLVAMTTLEMTTSKPSGPASAECVASWYGAPGEIPIRWPTASGDPFNPDAMATAALQWGFGTMLRVTNKANGQSVDVRVNDRGPFVAGRCVDLTKGAFQKIGNLDTGLLNVRIKRIN